MIIDEATSDRVVARAPAKLNLYLDVLGRRDDGYHEIESVMQTIDLFDRLTVTRASGTDVTLEVTGRPCPVDGNLVLRAAEEFFSCTGRRSGFAVVLQKIVPMGAGLGGGSSDAACMLGTLNLLLDQPLAHSELERIGARVGSDVPFFFSGGAAIARGRGERIEPLSDRALPRFSFVLHFPGVNVSTAAIYSSLNLRLTGAKNDLRRAIESLATVETVHDPEFFNALAEPFRRLYPELAALQDRVSRETGYMFHLTGSGSAIFAAVEDRAAGLRVQERLQAVAAGETFVVESLPGEGWTEG